MVKRCPSSQKAGNSSYDQSDAYHDVFWKTKVHHEQFRYMLQEFQSSSSSRNFGITDNQHYDLAKEYR